MLAGSPVTLPGADPLRRSALPWLTRPMVPRDQEVAEIRGLLARDAVRLLTLVGAPGTGKTHLALTVLDDLASTFRDEAVFVDLVPVRDQALVMSAIGTALGIQDTGDRDLADSVMA